MSRPSVFVGVTTLPSRIGRLRPTVDSLLTQTLPPDRIFVSVPPRSVREGREYVVPDWLLAPPPGVELVRCPTDFGPATKLLGCLPHIGTDACLIVVDDDMAYKPELVERLYRAQVLRPDAAFSFFVFQVGRLRFGQGADGFSFWTPNLAGIEAFAEVALQSRHLFAGDDVWISLFLQNKGVSIESLQHTLPLGELVRDPTHAENQLSHLDGDLRPSNVIREGTRYFFSTDLPRPRLRLLHWLGRAEGKLGSLGRRVRRDAAER
jgi:hypothetical protein